MGFHQISLPICLTFVTWQALAIARLRICHRINQLISHRINQLICQDEVTVIIFHECFCLTIIVRLHIIIINIMEVKHVFSDRINAQVLIPSIGKTMFNCLILFFFSCLIRLFYWNGTKNSNYQACILFFLAYPFLM